MILYLTFVFRVCFFWLSYISAYSVKGPDNLNALYVFVLCSVTIELLTHCMCDTCYTLIPAYSCRERNKKKKNKITDRERSVSVFFSFLFVQMLRLACSGFFFLSWQNEHFVVYVFFSFVKHHILIVTCGAQCDTHYEPKKYKTQTSIRMLRILACLSVAAAAVDYMRVRN